MALNKAVALELGCFKWKNEGCQLVILQQLLCDNTLSYDNDFHLFCLFLQGSVKCSALKAFGPVTEIPV